MPRVDFDKIDDVQDFKPVPEGRYLCRLIEVDKSSTGVGDEMWKMRFQILKGEHAGRYIFDNLPFSGAAMKRVKHFCSQMGLKTVGVADVEPEMVRGKVCYVVVEIQSYTDGENRLRTRNVVPFSGFEKASEADVPAEQPRKTPF